MRGFSARAGGAWGDIMVGLGFINYIGNTELPVWAKRPSVGIAK